MFGTKKLKARIAELEKENYNLESDRKQAFDELLDMERLKNASEKEIEKLKKSLEIEHESYLEKNRWWEENTRDLNKALDFLDSEGYDYGRNKTKGEGSSPIWISGKSKLSVELEEKLKAREGLIDNLNHLRTSDEEAWANERSAIYAEMDELKAEKERLDSTLFKINHGRALRSLRRSNRQNQRPRHLGQQPVGVGLRLRINRKEIGMKSERAINRINERRWLYKQQNIDVLDAEQAVNEAEEDARERAVSALISAMETAPERLYNAELLTKFIEIYDNEK